MFDLSANNRRLAKNTIFLYLRMVFVMLISFYTTRIILESLGVIDYGLYNVVAGFVSLFAVLNNCLTTGTNRFYNFALGKNDIYAIERVFNASLRIQFIIIILLLIMVETVGIWYINSKMVIPIDRLDAAKCVFHFSVISIVFVVFQVPYSSAVLAYERMSFFAMVSVFDALCKLGIAFFLQVATSDLLVLYGVLMMLISIANFLLYYFYCKFNFPFLRFCRKTDRDIFKSLLSFSSWSTLDPLSYILRDQGSNMVLNLFFGPVVNAAYGISRTISSAVTSMASNISVAFRPQIIQSYSSANYERTRTLAFSMSKINFFLQVLIAVPVIVEMDSILNLWLKGIIPDNTVWFASLVLIINCINVLNEPVSIIMVATGKIKIVKSISLVIIISVIPIGFFLFVMGFPSYYIYIAMLFLTILNQVSCVFIMTRQFQHIKVKEYVKIIAIPCLVLAVCSIVIPLIITFFLSPSIIRIVLVFFSSFIATFLLAYYICFDTNEKYIVNSIINEIIKKCRL